MKFIAAIAILILSVAYTINMQPPVADKAAVNSLQPALTEKGKKFVVDTSSSTVGWIGTKPSGTHNGSIKINDGAMQVKKSQILSGSFTIDMKTIADLDMTGKGKQSLEGHLKSADFFDVTNYPTATFELTGVSPVSGDVLLAGATHNLSGNLTMRGVTQNISFPAAISIIENNLTATADFNIDRSLWGMTYGTDGKVAKEINIKLNIKAAK
jgi:polyisoprenoid-binding protein YceI